MCGGGGGGGGGGDVKEDNSVVLRESENESPPTLTWTQNRVLMPFSLALDSGY